MREIRLYGSEGGVPRKRGIPTPIRRQDSSATIRRCARLHRTRVLCLTGMPRVGQNDYFFACTGD